MSRKHFVAAMSIFALSAPMSGYSADLKLESAYVVNGIDDLQPSGMAYCQGKLLFVSDKHDHEIYELLPDEDGIATARKFMDVNNIPEPPQQSFPFWTNVKRFFAELFGISGGGDWEGLACNDRGDYYLASEYYFSVLKIEADGTKSWIGSDLYNVGYDAGLFQKDNAYFEGISLKGENEIILAAEREPRGFLVISEGGDVKTYVQPGSVISDEGLPLDFTGLDMRGPRLFALERNHYKVCELEADYSEKECYSYRKIALSDEWGYSTGKYGLAEGLAINSDSIWIIVDNNGDERRQGTNDSRSTLMKFNNPFSM